MKHNTRCEQTERETLNRKCRKKWNHHRAHCEIGKKRVKSWVRELLVGRLIRKTCRFVCVCISFIHYTHTHSLIAELQLQLYRYAHKSVFFVYSMSIVSYAECFRAYNLHEVWCLSFHNIFRVAVHVRPFPRLRLPHFKSFDKVFVSLVVTIRYIVLRCQ